MPLAEQELQIAKHERDRDRCKKCHGDPATCSDPTVDWFPQRTVCYADMTTAGANRLYHLLHKERPFHDGSFSEWAAEASAAFPYRYDDGVNVWTSPVDLTPGDDFLTDPAAPAVPRGGEHRGHEA